MNLFLSNSASKGIFIMYIIVLGGTFSSLAQQGQSSVHGKITDNDGLPISYANVYFKELDKGALSDGKGAFVVEGLPRGNHQLLVSHIGFGKRTVQVALKSGERKDLGKIVLFENGSDLQEVIVSDRKVNRFADKATEYVARMPLENLENPQVYSVVNKELLQEQVLTDIDQSVRNATGVVPVVYPSGGFAATFRGFNIGINSRNGMETSTGRSSVDIGNVERIEVLKGPSGTLFGSNVSSFGGVVNLVTKKPTEDKQTEIGYTTGSFNLHRITADINTPLTRDKKTLFRLNTALNRQKSFLDYGFNNTFLIAPSLKHIASDRLSLTLDAELFDAKSTRTLYSRYGTNSGITSPEDLLIDYNKVLFHEDANASTSSLKLFTQAQYRLAANWTSTTLFSYVEEDVDHSYQYYATWLSPGLAARNIGNWGPIYNSYTNIQENINGEFATGTVRHKMLVGASLRFMDARSEAATSGFIDTVDVTTDFRVLRKQELDPYMVAGNWPGWHRANDNTYSVYVSDVLELTDRLSTMLSLRLDHFSRPDNGAVEGYEQTSLAPKLGLVYQLVKEQVSVFGNYMNGFQNQAPANQPDGALLVLDPLYAEQAEGGVKAEVFDKRLTATISYYHIAIDNAVRTNADGFVEQDGRQVSKGGDFEVVANPIAGLNIVGGYAFNDNRIVKASDEDIEGNKAVGAPENVANLWLSYALQGKLKGLGIGVGGNYVDENYLFSDNVVAVPSYTLLNASIFFEQPSWRLGLKGNNLANEKYWSSYGVAQAPANFAANLTVRF
ncbi:TonB-dependent siderophore receptor [Echinicola vietnamensis DSM 17526]|uniref:TonB-dependent siderophore receptor n=2 Tax=Echinicola TaxID=390846 RepID=L0G2T9_ECHVK|nr:TonB-dependent siderophore receptor [Echinicola vietnamensis DSM 17526]